MSHQPGAVPERPFAGTAELQRTPPSRDGATVVRRESGTGGGGRPRGKVTGASAKSVPVERFPAPPGEHSGRGSTEFESPSSVGSGHDEEGMRPDARGDRVLSADLQTAVVARLDRIAGILEAESGRAIRTRWANVTGLAAVATALRLLGEELDVIRHREVFLPAMRIACPQVDLSEKFYNTPAQSSWASRAVDEDRTWDNHTTATRPAPTARWGNDQSAKERDAFLATYLAPFLHPVRSRVVVLIRRCRELVKMVNRFMRLARQLAKGGTT